MSQPRRRRGGFFNVILIIGIIAAVALFAWAEQKRRSVAKELEQTSQQLEEIRKSTRRSGEEVAKEVLAKVRAHIDVPADPEPTVATIIDVNKLRETSEFYLKADNGDHLIITANRAILYDPDRDLVIDVVPVRLDPSATPIPAASTPQGQNTAPASPAPSSPPVSSSPTPASTSPNPFAPR